MQRAIIAWIVQAALGLVGYGLVLFLSSGRLDWVWGWALLRAGCLPGRPSLLLIPINLELLVERDRGIRGTAVKTWDRWIVILATSTMLVSWIVAGLDMRLQWIGQVSLAYHVGGG
jgi:hypothetical protein